MSKGSYKVRDDPEGAARVEAFNLNPADAGAVKNLVTLMALQSRANAVMIEEYCEALGISDTLKGTAAIEGAAFVFIAHSVLAMEMGDRDGKPLSSPSCVVTTIANAVPHIATVLEVDPQQFADRIVMGIQHAVMARTTMQADVESPPN